jgi:hypothetical protein
VSLGVPSVLTRRWNVATAVLIWKTPDATACDAPPPPARPFRRGAPRTWPASRSWKLILLPVGSNRGGCARGGGGGQLDGESKSEPRAGSGWEGNAELGWCSCWLCVDLDWGFLNSLVGRGGKGKGGIDKSCHAKLSVV